jgi:hypothetical protein
MDVARDPTLQAAGALPLERTHGAVAALGDVLDRGVVMVSRVERKKIETLFGEPSISSRWCASDCAASAAPGRVLAHRHRPESQTPGRARHEAAATAHDSLTNAEKPQHNSLDRPPTASADRLRREDTVRPPRSGPQISRPTQTSPTAAAVSGIMLAGSEIATGQQEPSELQLRKADLEVEKLEL